MRATSARYWSAMAATDTAPMSTFWRATSWRSRSNGPSKPAVETR